MKNSGGVVVLSVIAVMFASFALSTDQVWMRIGAVVGAGFAVAALVRSQRSG